MPISGIWPSHPENALTSKLLNFTFNYPVKKNERKLDSVSRLKKDFPDTTVLEAQRAEIEKSLAELNANPQKTDELQRQIGVLDHQIDGIRSELKRFLSLENQPDCHVCGQPISSDHLRTMIAEHQQAETERGWGAGNRLPKPLKTSLLWKTTAGEWRPI